MTGLSALLDSYAAAHKPRSAAGHKKTITDCGYTFTRHRFGYDLDGMGHFDVFVLADPVPDPLNFLGRIRESCSTLIIQAAAPPPAEQERPLDALINALKLADWHPVYINTSSYRLMCR